MRSFLALVAIFFAMPALADDKVLRTAQSLYDGVREETLPNGLRVFLKPIPGHPTVTTMVAYKVGSADEELDQTGLSHYLEHLMFKGTDKLMPGDIDRLTQRNGGHNNAYTSEDMTVYHFDFAADRWKTALDIESQRMRGLRIDDKHEFQQEKGAVISELNGNEDRPGDLENKLLLPMLFGPSTPYGHPIIGEKKHVESATAEIIKKHYDRWYHPNNAALVVVGGFDEADAIASIRKLFGPIPKGELPARKPMPELKPRTELVRKTFTSKFATGRLFYGYNTVDERHADAVPLDIVAHLLAGGRTSRLYVRLIEEDGSATGIESTHMPGRYPGWLSITADLLGVEDQADVEKAIGEEIARLAKDGPTEAELKRARRTMIAAHIFGHEDIHELADTIARGVVANDMAYVRSYLPDLMKLTAADIKRVAQKYLIDQKPVLLESMPAKAPAKEDKVHLQRRLYRDPPAKSAGQGMSLDKSRTVVLENGLKLLLLENHRLPIVVAEAQVGHVRLNEPADKIGIAALMSTLLDQGTKTRTGTQISELIEDAGGALSMRATGGTVKVLTDDTDLGLDLLFDCLMSPRFDKDDFEAKQEQVLTDLADQDTVAETRAKRAFNAAIYGEHPYGRVPAKPEVVKELTPKDLRQFHKKLFVPNNTVVAIVGDFDSEAIVAGIKKRTAEWKAAKFDKPSPPALPAPASKEQVISDPNAAQLAVFMGHQGIKRSNPDYYKLLVMDYVLGTGSGFTDRLSANLRDRQGLAYSVNAQITSTAGDEPGTFLGYIGTFPDKYDAVKKGFLAEVKRIREEPPTKDEVESAKDYLIGSLAFTMNTNEDVAGMLLAIDRYQLGTNYLEEYRKKVAAVTPEDVTAVAKQYLQPDKLIIIAAGAIDADGKPLPEKK